jgi:hypothetical protein
MAGSFAIKISGGCPSCRGTACEIWFAGNHGEEFKLETHCAGCGWRVDGEGNLQDPGRNAEGVISAKERR